MQVIHSFEEARDVVSSVVTFGMFDGVHVGHQHIIQTVVQEAGQINAIPVVITFHPHPREVLQPGFKIDPIISSAEKIKKIEKLGIKILLDLPFTLELSQWTGEEFINAVWNSFHPKIIIAGKDHRFGKNRRGDFELLTQFMSNKQGTVRQIEGVEFNNRRISSTWIREEIQNKNTTLVKKLLF